jgi:phosphoribosylaminoimidazole-succinocarboxamide synthase
VSVVLETHLSSLPLLRRGKVRDVYRVEDRLLIIATDRLSAFDYVLPSGIPGKGCVLTEISRFWFDRTRHLVPNHLVASDPAAYPPVLAPHAELLRGRSMLVRSLEMFPVECVVRGFLAGSGWKEYQQTGAISGVKLPAGLRSGDRLPEPIFTPSTKAETGHDENISFGAMVEIVGRETAERLRALSLEVYRFGCDLAERRGILIADTKFEFGRGLEGEIVLGDEVLTPDSSRFWPLGDHRPGREQPSFDKQFVRDYLERIGWDKRPPVPELPADIVAGTAARYRELCDRLTGSHQEKVVS